MKSKKIAVVMGGPSAEREVSLNTGQAILKALKEKGYDAIAIDLEPARFIDQLRETGTQVVFNAIHGRYGEDGCLQGALELLGIPYTGSGVATSAIAIDKAISKKLFIAAGIPTPRSRVYSLSDVNGDIAGEILAEFGVPVVIKAATQGSSIGVIIPEQAEALKEAVEQAFKYSDHVVIEEFIKGREFTVTVLGGEGNAQALPIVEIVPHSGKYDYHSKYTKGTTEYIMPAKLDEAMTKFIQELAVKVFDMFGCRGIVRVDVLLQADKPYVLEVNTIPGMTATSLAPKAAEAAGVSFADLCERILLMAK